MASHPPSDPRFDAKRHWRGLVWLLISHMIADGLALSGQEAASARIIGSSLIRALLPPAPPVRAVILRAT